jgi:hypothetical protein
MICTQQSSRLMPREAPGSLSTELWRKRLLWLAVFVAALSAVHLADHVIRGNIVVTHGLNPHWNHSGWPFQPRFSPFTIALIIVPLTFIIGIAALLRGRLMASFWVVTLILLLGFVALTHFIGSTSETPSVIYQTYSAVGSPVAGIIAVLILLSIVACGSALVVLAAWAGSAYGRSQKSN